MLALGIDTSSPTGSIGFADEADHFAELTVRSARTHSERLLPSIRALSSVSGFRLRDVGVVAVACGPGSFTGLRIGMATAKGLGIAIACPVVGFSTLETIALACARAGGVERGGRICVLLDAGRNEVYRGVFRYDGPGVEASGPEEAIAPRLAVEGLPATCVICGDGLRRYGEQIRPGLPGKAVIAEDTPVLGVLLARRALSSASASELETAAPLVPNYLRPSDAEKHFRG